MIDALIVGKLCGAPVGRSAKNGNKFSTAKVRAVDVKGEAIFVNVITFQEDAVSALLAFSSGDSIALSGELSVRIWVDKNGKARPTVDLTAHAVLSPYHVRRKRQGIFKEPQTASVPSEEFNDDIHV